MRHNRCSKIISLVPSTSSSQESNQDNNNDLSLSTTNENNFLNDADLHNSSDNIFDFNSDDSVFDKDFLPSSLDPSICSEDSEDSSTNTIPNSQPMNITTVPESPEISSNEDTPQDLTKKGTLRKRKKYYNSPAQRKEIKRLKDIESKYQLKPGCNVGCKKKCHSQFTEEARQHLNNHFRNMSWKEQQYFIINNTSKEEPKRKTVKENRKLRRNTSVLYFLTNETGAKVNVCKVFFLETLGYSRKNDKSVRNALYTKTNNIPVDNRGINSNPKKFDETKVVEHINSFNPSISHYRREHAPNRKYLPSDLTVTRMYQDFCEQHDLQDPPAYEQVSYEYYRKVVKKCNICFTKLGHEECEVCEKFFIHNPEYKEQRHRNCQECRDYERHREKYTSAREAYKKDVEKQNNANTTTETAYFAADLEKVIMLPRINEFKIVMFCPRVIVFNESFVPIGDKKNNDSLQTFAAIWHEAIAGRKMSDIISCFRAFLQANRDLKNLVIWLDNCAAQNKNWTLYSYLLHLVNSVEVSYVTITLKYLEVGHTHMAADEFHHQVELSMKRKKHIYDFEDFHQAVSNTRTNIIVKEMNMGDFCQFEDCSSTYKLQNSSPRAYLNDMCEVTFFRGTHVISYKTAFHSEETHSLDFLRLKNIKSGIPPPKPNNKFRGITQERKSAIIQKLTPLMPDNRKSFWYNLPIDKNSLDLTQVDEE